MRYRKRFFIFRGGNEEYSADRGASGSAAPDSTDAVKRRWAKIKKKPQASTFQSQTGETAYTLQPEGETGRYSSKKEKEGAEREKGEEQALSTI